MKLMHAMSALVIAGVCLVAISFGWQSLVGGKRAWSDEQAKEHARLSGEGHHKMHERAEGPAGRHTEHPAKSGEESLEEIKERYQQSREELQQAQSRGATTALVFRWLGAVCTVIGGAGYFVLRNREI
jgi:hypothetical protein